MYPITERDHEIILSVYRYRYLTTSQIARLHFPSARTAQRRLSVLTGHKLLAHFSVPNIGERLYMLTTRGANLVADMLDVSPDDLLWSAGTKPPKDYYFIKHFVAISDFRITLTHAVVQSDISLLGFIPEHYGAKHLSGRVTKYIKDVAFSITDPKEKITHTPDAVFALEKNQKQALFFLEIDRGTETISNPAKGIGKMIRFYEGYAQEEKYRGYAEDFHCEPFSNFRLLIVTTSARRVENIRAALGTNAPQLYRFFWLTTYDQVNEETIFDRIWSPLDAGDEKLYKIA